MQLIILIYQVILKLTQFANNKEFTNYGKYSNDNYVKIYKTLMKNGIWPRREDTIVTNDVLLPCMKEYDNECAKGIQNICVMLH